ncbi:MAG: 50S ribosomal protein L35 [Candidatus Omnitrophica bacterium]|nr:50S ribosomal protein L35 [Candidatus Omnitrophota bacterium]MBD3269766.1 50S ribosomal protein L35 [Candidatus Omnitrophota bacterium]
MPKLKTKKSLAKRVKVTKNKKIMRSKAGRRHLLSNKNRKRKRNLRKKDLLPETQKKTVKRGLPYSL